MMQNQPAVNSAHQARAILGAWNSGDIDLFHAELDRVGRCAMGYGELEGSESEEVERMELLRAIAADLRTPSIKPLADEPGNVHGSLLRHLACSYTAKRHRGAARAAVLQ